MPTFRDWFEATPLTDFKLPRLVWWLFVAGAVLAVLDHFVPWARRFQRWLAMPLLRYFKRKNHSWPLHLSIDKTPLVEKYLHLGRPTSGWPYMVRVGFKFKPEPGLECIVRDFQLETDVAATLIGEQSSYPDFETLRTSDVLHRTFALGAYPTYMRISVRANGEHCMSRSVRIEQPELIEGNISATP